MKRLALIVAAAVLVGCDRQSNSKGPTTAPVVANAATQPSQAATVFPPPVYPSRPPSVMAFDGQEVPFPAANLAVLGKSSGGLSVRLCSDDPPTSIDPGYAGNSFVFDMTLPVDSVQSLPLAVWDYKSSNTDLPDEATGIYLHGYHEQLHPTDVHVTFRADGVAADQFLVVLTGTFLHFDSQTPLAPPRRVQVNTCLRAVVSK
jgi:hypothetical protein